MPSAIIDCSPTVPSRTRSASTSAVTAWPIRSILPSCRMRGRRRSSSAGASRPSKIPQTSDRQMTTTTLGSGMPSPNRRAMTRSVISRLAARSTIGRRRDAPGNRPRRRCSNPRFSRRARPRPRISEARARVRSSQYRASYRRSAAAMSASTGSSKVSPVGAASRSTSSRISVSMRDSNARSMSTPPASARSTPGRTAAAKLPSSSSSSNSKICSAKRSIAGTS